MGIDDPTDVAIDLGDRCGVVVDERTSATIVGVIVLVAVVVRWLPGCRVVIGAAAVGVVGVVGLVVER